MIKKLLFLAIFPLVLFTLSSCNESPENPAKEVPNVLNIELVPTFNGKPITIGDYLGAIPAGDTLKLTTWKQILSAFKLNLFAGGSLALPNQYAYLAVESNRLKFSLTGVSQGDYNGLDFLIGLDSATNHSDPAQYPGDHPLNPALNGMHWGWAGGYLFMVLEGEYTNGKKANYSFHMATDLFEKPIHVAIPFFSFAKSNTTKTIVLELKLDEVFKNPSNYSMFFDGNYSHSGSSDSAQMVKMFNNIGDIYSFKEFK